MTVDTYRYPVIRRAIFALFRLESWIKDALLSLRYASHWTIGAVVVALVFLVDRRWAWGIALGFVFALNVAIWISERIGGRGKAIGQVDAMSGRQFERWLGKLYERRGFAVERTPYSGDYGADLILTWHGVRVAVQAKSGHQNAGVNAVQQVHAAKSYYGCEKAVVVTNQYFTEQALLLAEKLDVRMRHRGDLIRMIGEERTGP